jgi:hypothetical protein
LFNIVSGANIETMNIVLIVAAAISPRFC